MNKLKFIDFCAGIGGGRIGLEKVGMKCVGFSEIDYKAEKTYKEIFNSNEINLGDLMKINPKALPNFDLMIAGFPCQSFSINGKRRGMNDHRGQIIYGLINIMTAKRIPYFILENVKGLINHEKGKTFKIILEELTKSGYKVYYKLLNSLDYGVPQMRERIYFVGIRKDLVNNKEFEWLTTNKKSGLKNYLTNQYSANFEKKKSSYTTFLRYLDNEYNKGQFNTKKLLKDDYLILDTRQSDLRLYRNKVPTLRTGRHGILYVKNHKFYKLSGLESMLLQGFPKEISKRVSHKIPDITLLSQAGNAMTVNLIEMIGKSLLKYIQK